MNYRYSLRILLIVTYCVTAIKFSQAQTREQCGWQYLYGPKGKINLAGKIQPAPATGMHLQNLDDTPVVTLPVVVHILHTGGTIGTAYNPTDNQVNAMISLLNSAWRKSSPNFGGVDMRIQFALATKGPDCLPTTGINRVNASAVPNYSSGGIAIASYAGSATERSVKKLSRWPNTDYINIWIVNKINGSEQFPGGFAYFPEYNSALDDGITLLAGTVDGVNQTIVHEMGHYFNLMHSFADDSDETTCPANANCTDQGDRVCDTEPTKNVVCGTAINPCTGQPYQVADAAKGFTVLHNYMGYGICAAMFTDGQRQRVHDALQQFRKGLLSSTAFLPNITALPATACVPVAANGLSPYYGVQKVEVNDYAVYSNTSAADSTTYVDRTCNQRFYVSKGKKMWLAVTASYENWSAIKVLLDANNNGSFDDAGEQLMFTYGGVVSDSVVLPTAALLNVPLRLRVLADHWQEPAPTACVISGPINGAGQAEDFSLIIQRRKIVSVKSGNWNDVTVWDCGCVPGAADEVMISGGHAITFSAAMGQGRCFSMSVGAQAQFIQSGDFKVIGVQ